MKNEALEAINDPELQKLALEAIKKAAKAKLGGDEAWAAAFAEFKDAALGRGRELGTAILETILQNMYFVFKFTNKEQPSLPDDTVVSDNSPQAILSRGE